MTKNRTNKNSAIELFKILDNKSLHKDLILEALNIKSSTFYNNIAKLKRAGFSVYHKNNIYEIKNFHSILKIDSQETSILAYMMNIARILLPKTSFISFKSLIDKYLVLSDRGSYDEIKKRYNLIKKCSLLEEFDEKIRILKLHICNKERITVTLRSNETIDMFPCGFEWKGDILYIKYTNPKTRIKEKISVEKVAKITSEPQTEPPTGAEEVIFELYGKLAKRYLLKHDERILDSTKESLVIASSSQNREHLFKRLLKYDTLCKILFPKQQVLEFTKLIQLSMSNINMQEG